jgi:hypothetical protein
VLEPAVLENHYLARVKLLPENRFGAFRYARPRAVIFIEIGLCAIAFPAQDVEDNKFFIVTVRPRYNVRMRSEQVDAEGSFCLPPIPWDEANKCRYQVSDLLILK